MPGGSKLPGKNRHPDSVVFSPGLYSLPSNANFDPARLQQQIDEAAAERDKLPAAANMPEIPVGVLGTSEEDIRSWRELLTYGMKGIGAYADHAAILGVEDQAVYDFLIKGLAATVKPLSVDALAKLVIECGHVAVLAMAALDRANTSNYGRPEITTVKTGVGKRPGILISGHDLKDMAELLEQTLNSGVDIYTHGEMLPAHYYPAFKKYPHLVGNYGGAWQNQWREFDAFPGAILMTTNCIQKPRPTYIERIFTTGLVEFPGVVHVKNGDFSTVIEAAKRAPGFPETEPEKNITVGFGHDAVAAAGGAIVDAVKSGKIRHFFLIGGCDGAKPGRNYYTQLAEQIPADCVILTAGTFLAGMMYCGRSHAEGGRAGDSASHGVTESLVAMGFEAGRMKTGTPARLDARTINFEILEPQYGDENPSKFSFSADTHPVQNQLPCFLVYTSKKVHDILRKGFGDSPLFNGTIRGIGPRYCPSIEDKLNTFADKDQHQLFLEPEGRSTNEYYLNGFSSSLPWDIQWEALHAIEGFEDLHIFRPGYAIEYDYFLPTQLHHSLETKLVDGLYFAGQINGTTGYEEAGAQGLMAGINAHRRRMGEEPLVLARDEAYIGVLIDDLVTKGVDEPYRMFTSRAEYRILLRQDDADMRLTEKSYQMGLAKQDRYDLLREKKESRDAIIRFAETYSVKPQYINSGLEKLGTAPLSHGCKLFDVVLRPQTTLENLADLVPALRAELDKVPASRKEEIIEAAEILIKYSGYIKREQIIADKINRLENIRIKGKFDYNSIQSLSTEARQKLTRIDPDTIAQASRIPGISPSDINILLVLLGR